MAITKETIRTLIREGQEIITEVELYDRPFDFEENGRYVLVGVRQTGCRLKKLHAFQPLKRMVIVTFDEEETIGLDDGKAIEVIPAWKWLME